MSIWKDRGGEPFANTPGRREGRPNRAVQKGSILTIYRTDAEPHDPVREAVERRTGLRGAEGYGKGLSGMRHEPEEVALVDADLLLSGWQAKHVVLEGGLPTFYYHLPPSTDWMPWEEAWRLEYRVRREQAARTVDAAVGREGELDRVREELARVEVERGRLRRELAQTKEAYAAAVRVATEYKDERDAEREGRGRAEERLETCRKQAHAALHDDAAGRYYPIDELCGIYEDALDEIAERAGELPKAPPGDARGEETRG